MLKIDLSNLPDNVLVDKVKKDSCSDSFLELSRRHSNLFYKISNNYIKILASLGMDPKDILEEKDAVLYDAILKYNANHLNKTKFSTWLGNYTRYFCLHKIKKVKKMPEIGDEDAIKQVFESKSIEEYETRQSKINLQGILNKLMNIPDKRIANIFKLRYNPELAQKMTWDAIADQLELTIQTTQFLHKKGIQLLRQEINKKNIEVFL
jgi:hypothetical protein